MRGVGVRVGSAARAPSPLRRAGCRAAAGGTAARRGAPAEGCGDLVRASPSACPAVRARPRLLFPFRSGVSSLPGARESGAEPARRGSAAAVQDPGAAPGGGRARPRAESGGLGPPGREAPAGGTARGGSGKWARPGSARGAPDPRPPTPDPDRPERAARLVDATAGGDAGALGRAQAPTPSGTRPRARVSPSRPPKAAQPERFVGCCRRGRGKAGPDAPGPRRLRRRIRAGSALHRDAEGPVLRADAVARGLAGPGG